MWSYYKIIQTNLSLILPFFVQVVQHQNLNSTEMCRIMSDTDTDKKKHPVEEKLRKTFFIELMNILNELETVQNNL